MKKTALLSCLALSISFLSASAMADEVQVAVAANFTAPMKIIAADFQKATGHTAQLSFGATGKFYQQIGSGAPFEVLFSADDETPARLEKENNAVAGTRFTYATGKLALWSASSTMITTDGNAVLAKGDFKHVAIASPKLAPYGAAAVQTMTNLKLLPGLQDKLVTGESIGQAYSFVATGAAELGFVALSQIVDNGKLVSGSMWVVPEELHSPIRQDAVLLTKGKDNAAARALLAYVKTEPARKVIRSFGYDLP